LEDPLNAILAALALQRRVADPAATGNVSPRICCGIHVGVEQHRDEGFYENSRLMTLPCRRPCGHDGRAPWTIHQA